MYNVTIFGLELTVDPIAFTLPFGKGWDIYWYGICITLGFVLALLYAFRSAKRFGINTDRMLDVILVTTPLAVLCARLYYIIFFGEKITSLGDFFGFSGAGFAGLAIYGGVLGAVGIGAIMCLLRKVNIGSMFDLASIGFLIGQACGRWGNFFNQEAFGGPTGSTFLGMTSQPVAAELGEGVLAHPCFLYESLWCIAGFFVLHLVSKKRRYAGQVAYTYCVWYGFGRMVIEGLRTDSLMLGSFRVSQLLSLLLILFGAAMLTFNHLRSRKAAQYAAYTPMFDDAEDADEIDDEAATAAEPAEAAQATPQQATTNTTFEEDTYGTEN